MADHYSICLIGAMDSLWFHGIIFFSEPNSLIPPKTLKSTRPSSETSPITYPSSSFSSSSSYDNEKPSDTSPDTLTGDYSNEEKEDKEMKYQKERPTRLNSVKERIRSQSSSPEKHYQKRRLLKSSTRQYSNLKSSEVVQLQRSMSCRSLEDLELEEVKGFTDLGFSFEKEHISPQMATLIPGLQRAPSCNNSRHGNRRNAVTDEEDDDSEEYGVIRPYLSDAWSVMRPDSPLLKLRMQRANDGTEMKKHILFWAKIVASEVGHQQEC